MKMNEIAKLFYDIEEPLAAGLFEEPEKGLFYRCCLAHARFYEHRAVAEYRPGELLYPCGKDFLFPDYAVSRNYGSAVGVDHGKLKEKSEQADAIMTEFEKICYNPGFWAHAAPNYRRVVWEGLASYRRRCESHGDSEFHQGLILILDAFEGYLKRCVAYLAEVGAPNMLIDALQKVPYQPAESYYEGLVAWNVIFYFDGGDNLGCLDEGLAHLYRGEDLRDVIGQLFDNVGAVSGWSCTVGPVCNEITKQALYASRGRRRPMLELMVTEDTPDDIWEIAVESIHSGSTNPSFYNNPAILQMLRTRFPTVPEEEWGVFCGCGCTESNLQGLTRAGGTDDNISLLRIFEGYMKEHLSEAECFEDFYEGLCRHTEELIDEQLDGIVQRYLLGAEHCPNPVRSILFDDCIDKGKDFYAGGTRYTWTQSSDSGIINVIDSLLSLRELIWRRRKYTPADFLEKLAAEDEALRLDLAGCPHYGVDDAEADAIATAYATRVYQVYRQKEPTAFIDGYLLTEHQFLRHAGEGTLVGPTPDGRRNWEPTCDSIAALRGKGTAGPTAMLCSAAKMPQHLAEGISVLNLSINKNFVNKSLRSLIEGYFAMGGVQVQVTMTSKEELLDAMEHPEKHYDLIVRVGGYSEYFVNLPASLRRAIVERDIHELG